MSIKKLIRPSSILDNIKMRKKLLLLYFILIILPLSFFTLLTYSRISSVMRNQTLNSGTQVFEEASSILDKDFSSAGNVIKVLTGNNLVYDIVLRTYKEHDIIEEVSDMNELQRLSTYLISNTNLSEIHFYTAGDKILFPGGKILSNYDSVKDTLWYRDLSESGSNIVWSTPASNMGDDIFSVAQIFYDPDKLKQSIGIIKVDIRGERVDSIIKDSLVTANSITYISNKSGIARSTATSEVSSSIRLSGEMLTALEGSGWKKMRLGGNESFVSVKRISVNDWYLVTVIPSGDVAATANKLFKEMLVVMLLISIVAYILAYLISSSTVKRLSLLSSEMKKVETGSSEVHLNRAGNDEIGDLMEDFNYMVSRINTLAEEKYRLGIEIKSSELKALQAQINPHFLYNTLELINSTALINGIPEIASQVTTLARFYKLSLSRGKDIITIGEELEHVKTYVQIQNMRFQNRIVLNINADRELYKYKTLKIILQPIVENSILHGIFEKDSKNGTVSISVHRDSGRIRFVIEDDGVGMSQEKLDNLLVNEPYTDTAGSGYGIRNIHQRIRLYYGLEYGLEYRSCPGKGTAAVVTIPADA